MVQTTSAQLMGQLAPRAKQLSSTVFKQVFPVMVLTLTEGALESPDALLVSFADKANRFHKKRVG